MTKRAALGGAGLEPGAQREVQALARLAAADEAGRERARAVVARPVGAEARGVVAVAVAQQPLLRHAGVAERAGHEVGRAQQAVGAVVLALLARQRARGGARAGSTVSGARPSSRRTCSTAREGEVGVRVRALEQAGDAERARRRERALGAERPACGRRRRRQRGAAARPRGGRAGCTARSKPSARNGHLDARRAAASRSRRTPAGSGRSQRRGDDRHLDAVLGEPGDLRARPWCRCPACPAASGTSRGRASARRRATAAQRGQVPAARWPAASTRGERVGRLVERDAERLEPRRDAGRGACARSRRGCAAAIACVSPAPDEAPPTWRTSAARLEAHGVAGLPQPQAEVGVLAVEEQPLVEAADRLVGVAAHEHAGAGHPLGGRRRARRRPGRGRARRSTARAATRGAGTAPWRRSSAGAGSGAGCRRASRRRRGSAGRRARRPGRRAATAASASSERGVDPGVRVEEQQERRASRARRRGCSRRRSRRCAARGRRRRRRGRRSSPASRRARRCRRRSRARRGIAASGSTQPRSVAALR